MRRAEGRCPVCGREYHTLRVRCAVGHDPTPVEPLPDDRLWRRVARQHSNGVYYWTYVLADNDCPAIVSRGSA